ncbi:unnamed protein product [Darwinula stevensoni]|uniref:Uncharacterized protein n=1 Tax=Darwinula stevensoni TaxID=69355 RepID=A0A7R9AGU4_9CRUS|nr:unnamed protein product [Darwinula stevensoni]CAG0904858.1 unnamed protein product [Darwinula stevensoni]
MHWKEELDGGRGQLLVDVSAELPYSETETRKCRDSVLLAVFANPRVEVEFKYWGTPIHGTSLSSTYVDPCFYFIEDYTPRIGPLFEADGEYSNYAL